jgi:CheY-like chemotaxis protein
MEPMSGYGLLKKLRIDGDQVRFIMITSDTTAANLIAAGKAGVSGFIIKPFSTEKLKAHPSPPVTGRKAGPGLWVRLRARVSPKHASWLNMVEIEIGVLRSQCLDHRIDDKETILTEVAAWEKRRNAEGARIQWMFTTEKAREKLRKAYPVKES